jgi:hypothetical protein
VHGSNSENLSDLSQRSVLYKARHCHKSGPSISSAGRHMARCVDLLNSGLLELWWRQGGEEHDGGKRSAKSRDNRCTLS